MSKGCSAWSNWLCGWKTNTEDMATGSSFVASPTHGFSSSGHHRRIRRRHGAAHHLSQIKQESSSVSLCSMNRTDDCWVIPRPPRQAPSRSEEHTSELQSLMRISYAVFYL